MFFSRTEKMLSLRKSRHLLFQVYRLYKRKQKKLLPQDKDALITACKNLEQALLEKNREKASACATHLHTLAQTHLKKGFLEQLRDLFFALFFALSIAVLIRQMWFELYEIPSGSMRPTFKEKDRVIVSKTDFGINMPLTVKHLYFDRDLVKRNNIVIFSGENMDIPDVDTKYFYLFPGKKQYVKRLIGKPKDILYFYGGQIYGIDLNGNDISKELQQERLSAIEHIPFIDFMRKTTASFSPTPHTYPSIVLYQMNEPIAKLFVSSHHQVHGEMLPLTEIHDPTAPAIEQYSDLWGFNNFGMTRLLTEQQVKFFTDQDPTTLETAPLYLEIRHHPSINSAKLLHDESGRLSPSLGVETSIIPLQENHLRALFKALYTARFEVKNGFAYRYGTAPNLSGQNIFLPHLMRVPDGTYEFDGGIAYSIRWEGISFALDPSHPLYQFDPQRIQLLYNIGMEFDMRFSPQSKYQRFHPARYAYFREGNLYLMGVPILMKEDPTLQQFVEKEQKRKELAIEPRLYSPFLDNGPPFKEDGTLDAAFIRHYGLQIPDQTYLVLGDNHAMSGDSREFGFVPEDNLKGGPTFIFWPPGERWGAPNQQGYPWWNLPRVIIWTLGVGAIVGSSMYYRRKHKKPLNF